MGAGTGSGIGEGEVWTGKVPADREWLTADSPVEAMKRAYCPQVNGCLIGCLAG